MLPATDRAVSVASGAGEAGEAFGGGKIGRRVDPQPRPFWVAAVAAGRLVRAFFFLGAVPRAVLAAARRARGAPAAPVWAAADAAVLRAHYGPGWRELLTPAEPPAPRAWDRGVAAAFRVYSTNEEGDAIGGGSDDADLFAEFEADSDDLPPVFDAAPVAPRDARSSRAPTANAWPRPPAPGPPVYTDAAVQPEDTLLDLRLKLSVVADVPFYRQHFFYWVNGEGPYTPYRVLMDSTPVPADSLALGAPAAGAAVAGIAVDRALESGRAGLRVEALDTFVRVVGGPGLRITHAYFVDLYAVVPPLGTPDRPRDGLEAALDDPYLRDLLWWGGLLRAWPHLGAEPARLALADPARMRERFPDLDPDPEALRARFEAERPLAAGAARWLRSARAALRTAVTAASIRVPASAVRTAVDIRAIFDSVPLGESGGDALPIQAATARFDVEPGRANDFAASIAGDDYRGGPLPVLATKRHLRSYAGPTAAAVTGFVERVPPRGTVTFAIARPPAATAIGEAAAAAHIFLRVFSDGRYEASGGWREDDAMGFDAVRADVARAIEPARALINAAPAFATGGELAPIAEQAHTSSGSMAALGGLTVSAYWPHPVSSEAFATLRREFRDLERAGIVSVRGLQLTGAYTFAFRKGIVAYDRRLADRAEAARGEVSRPAGANQYRWLTDATVAARWATSFGGRTVRIFHRATDIRVEVAAADSLAEFELIAAYVFSFLDGLRASGRLRALAGADAASEAQRASATVGAKAVTGTARLRRLQERDPVLFDLKRADERAPVYSVLCQAGRQPLVHDPAEIAALPRARRERAFRYWNFTRREAAWYECPDKAYPHLSLRRGAHPLGYCLPCCKKTLPAPGSRADLAWRSCSVPPLNPGGEGPAVAVSADEGVLSRHALAYGKALPPGRCGEPPAELASGLFLGAVPAGTSLALIGVEQNGAAGETGFASAVAAALEGLSDAPTAAERRVAVFGEIAVAAAALSPAEAVACGGDSDPAALAHDIVLALVEGAPLTRFAPGAAPPAETRALLAALVLRAFGAHIVVFEDTGPARAGRAGIMAVAPPVSIAALTGGDTERFIILVDTPTGIYPLALGPTALLARASAEDLCRVTRRVFTRETQGEVPDGVVAAVAPVFADANAAGATIESDIAAVTRRVPHAVAESALVDGHGRCYGIQFTLDGKRFVAPTDYGPPPADLRWEYGPRLAPTADRATVCAAAGMALDDSAGPDFIVDAAGRHWWFAGGRATAPVTDHPWGPQDAAAAYPAEEISAAISALQLGGRSEERPGGRSEERPGGRDAGQGDPVAGLAAVATWRGRAYTRFVAAFAEALRRERNEPMRQRLITQIQRADFTNADSLAAMRRALILELRDSPADLSRLRAVLSRAAASADPVGAAVAAIAATRFDFDARWFVAARQQTSTAAIVADLRKLMRDRVRAIDSTDATAIAEAAANNNYGHASGPAAVPADRLDDFYNLLAADIRNDTIAELIPTMAAGVFDSLEFRKEPKVELRVTLGLAAVGLAKK